MRDMDVSNSEKNGILLIEDPLEREWVPHFFVLTKTKMSYTEVHQEENEPEEADEDQADLSLKEVKFFKIIIVLYCFILMILYLTGCSRLRFASQRGMVSQSSYRWPQPGGKAFTSIWSKFRRWSVSRQEE